MTNQIVSAPDRIRSHRGRSTRRLLHRLWSGDLRASGSIFQHAYVGPAEREYLLALWRSRNTDSGQAKGWSLACRATRPRPAPQVGSTGHRRQARSVHLPPFSKDRRLRTCPPQNASLGSFCPKMGRKGGDCHPVEPTFAIWAPPSSAFEAHVTCWNRPARRHTARIELTLADQSASAAGLQIPTALPPGIAATNLWQMDLGRL